VLIDDAEQQFGIRRLREDTDRRVLRKNRGRMGGEHDDGNRREIRVGQWWIGSEPCPLEPRSVVTRGYPKLAYHRRIQMVAALETESLAIATSWRHPAPMTADRLLISCRSCRRAVALVRDVDAAALIVLARHLRCLHRNTAPGEEPTPKELLRRFRVATASERWPSTMGAWPA